MLHVDSLTTGNVFKKLLPSSPFIRGWFYIYPLKCAPDSMLIQVVFNTGATVAAAPALQHQPTERDASATAPGHTLVFSGLPASMYVDGADVGESRQPR
jgi:hypothetical protein